jgi:hypothetical protein
MAEKTTESKKDEGFTIDFTQPIFNLNETDEQYYNKPVAERATLMKFAQEGLLGPDKQGETVEGMEKLRRYELSILIGNEPTTAVLKPEDISLIKKRIGELFPSLIVGQAWPMLDRLTPKRMKKEA